MEQAKMSTSASEVLILYSGGIYRQKQHWHTHNELQLTALFSDAPLSFSAFMWYLKNSQAAHSLDA